MLIRQEKITGKIFAGIIGLISLLIISCLTAVAPAAAQDSAVVEESEEVPGGLNFQQAVDLAMRQSPAFIKSSLEIEVRKISESDSRYSFIPSLTVGTTYYINASGGSDPGMSYSFSTGMYSPFESYFSLQASKLFTKMAILGHIETISAGVYSLGKQFLQWDSAVKLEAYQDEIIDLTSQKASFLEKREKLGITAPLEVRIAGQGLAVAKASKENIIASRKVYRQSIGFMLGLTPEQRPDFDLAACRNQLLGGFDPLNVVWNDVRKKSLELQIQTVKEEIQDKNITLAYAKFIPYFNFGVRNVDPLSDSSDDNDVYLSVGVSVPLWQGMKRVNDIERQRLILQQTKSDALRKERDLSSEWQAALVALTAAENSLKLTASSEELARLQELQADILYKANSKPLDTLLDARIKYVQAKMETLQKETDRDAAILDIRYLSGNLLESFVKVEVIE